MIKKKRKMSKKSEQFINRTIEKLVDKEGYGQRQAIAIAYSKARKKGYHIPRK
jgi:hypothetical protein